MLFWRKFEDKLAAVYIQQKVRGFLHLYNGQEAVAAGCLHAMDLTKDKMITSYRCHVHPIGLGVDPKRIMAELYGKATGTSLGLGGSMHIFSKEHRFYGGHGIVGGQIALGAGLAFADKYFNREAVTLTFMGDGAVRQGAFHETLNLAMLWKLPVVFIVENNHYAMGTSVERTANHVDIWKLGLGYEMPCQAVDGMHPETVAEAVYEAIESNRIMGFATDVFEEEPPMANDPLLKIANHPRVIYTPHVAWASEYAQDKLWRILKRQVEDFIVKYKTEHKENEKA